MKLSFRSVGGFTLLEMLAAVTIALMMIGLALPSMRGLLAEKRLRERMAEFEEVVRQAASLAKSSRQEVRIRWFKEGLGVVTENTRADEVPSIAFEFQKDEVLELRRVAARQGNPPPEWSFWPNGIREPVEVACSSPQGVWGLRFGPFVPDPDVIVMQAR